MSTYIRFQTYTCMFSNIQTNILTRAHKVRSWSFLEESDDEEGADEESIRTGANPKDIDAIQTLIKTILKVQSKFEVRHLRLTPQIRNATSCRPKMRLRDNWIISRPTGLPILGQMDLN